MSGSRWLKRAGLGLFRLFTLLGLCSTLVLASTDAEARGAGGAGHFGLGIALGDPSAITAKYWLDGRQAADFGISFNFDRWVLLYTDYNLHWPGAFGGSAQFVRELAPYFGIGGILVFSNNGRPYRDDRYFTRDSSSTFALGMRIPVGIEWLPRGAPIGVFLEVGPGLTIIPGTSGFFTGAIGARFYF